MAYSTQPVQSSFIKEVAHNGHGVLRVTFHDGSVSRYKAPLHVFRQFQALSIGERSSGRFFNLAVRGVYPRVLSPYVTATYGPTAAVRKP